MGPLNFIALGDGQRKPKMHFGGLEKCMLICGAPYFMALEKNPKCILGAWKNALWFVGPVHAMALGYGQRKPKMHFGGLEKCILICGALSFDGPGGWTKEMQNSFMEPGKCILVCGAP